MSVYVFYKTNNITLYGGYDQDVVVIKHVSSSRSLAFQYIENHLLSSKANFYSLKLVEIPLDIECKKILRFMT